MNSLCVALALCVGPPSDAASAAPTSEPDDSVIVSLAVDRQCSSSELRSACTALIRKSAPRVKPDLAKVVPELVALYEVVGEADQLGPAAKRRLQDRIATRLDQLRAKLVRETSRVKREARRSTQLSAGQATPGAQALIDLIQTTVAPSSWEINGGLGTICYFPRYQALVIRQSPSAHRTIGGALKNVRP